MVRQADITQAAHTNGLAGLPLVVHSSLRSFGEIDGGPDAVVDGLLDAGCTMLVPTFSTHHYGIPEPLNRPDLCFERNATAELVDARHVTPAPYYTAGSTVINTNMGAVPRAVLDRLDRVRGVHPLNSFSAVGPLAKELLAGQSNDDVYAPLRTLANAGGVAILMGVGLDRMTLLHFAEQVAGRALFRRWVIGTNGEPQVARIGACSNGFERFAPVLAAIERTDLVGQSHWRMYPAAAAVARAAATIVATPEITRCQYASCARCPDAISGGPVERLLER